MLRRSRKRRSPCPLLQLLSPGLIIRKDFYIMTLLVEFWPHYFVDSVMARERRMAEATEYLKRALKIESYFPLALKELERILARYPAR